MTRITPRTCLWPLAGSLSVTFALSIGLTFRSNHHCYAGTCGEWLFPLQARLHVVVWYCWLGLSITLLAIRTFNPSLQKLLSKSVFKRKIPFLGKCLSLSGLLILLWIVCLYGTLIGIWWIRLNAYFTQRGIEGGVYSGNTRLAAIALTGHLCDVTMGMVILPISRHSALASFFKISVSTTLAFHMLIAYTLFALVVTHASLYVSWVPIWQSLGERLRMVFPVLNPTYLYEATWPGNRDSLGVWRASLIFTGSTTGLIFLLIFITTFPAIRNRHFNLFYFTHLFGIIAVVMICLHASTMFYCTAPGLAMWLLDWCMRVYELWAPLDARIEALGNGWYQITTPLPRRRLHGCACTSPLAHFYIHHSESSMRELHPFTTITHLASQNAITDAKEEDIEIQFLFRKRGMASTTPSIGVDGGKEREEEVKREFAPTVFSLLRSLKKAKSTIQWTDRLACLSDEVAIGDGKGKSIGPATLDSDESIFTSVTGSKGVPVSLRLEGPYFTPADTSRFATVVCLVAGTGISGALAIASAFKEIERQATATINSKDNSKKVEARCGESGKNCSRDNKGVNCAATHFGRKRTWTRCVIVWSVRETDYIDLEQLRDTPNSNLEVIVHLTGDGRARISTDDTLNQILGKEDKNDTISRNAEKQESKDGNATGTWVYISGPNAFITAGEAACKRQQERKQGARLEYYGARWDI